MSVRSMRRVGSVGPTARPLPTPLRFTTSDTPGSGVGVGGALYPEWDVHNNRYRPEHCRVIDFPLRDAPDVSAAGVQHDEVLRRRLSRVGLGPKVVRRRPDGDAQELGGLHHPDGRRRPVAGGGHGGQGHRHRREAGEEALEHAGDEELLHLLYGLAGLAWAARAWDAPEHGPS